MSRPSRPQVGTGEVRPRCSPAGLTLTLAFAVSVASAVAAHPAPGTAAPPETAPSQAPQEAADAVTTPVGVVVSWGELQAPHALNEFPGVAAIASGAAHRVVLRDDGTVWAWGANEHGQLGDGTTTTRAFPVAVVGLTNVVAIAAHQYHSLAVRSDGTVWAWGSNEYGQLGDGTTTDRWTPVAVTGLSGVVAVAAGGWHSLALRNDGTVRGWGHNRNGQLGDGTTTNRSTPVVVSGLTNVTAISADGVHSLALRSNGTVWAWGNNVYGQLGDGTTMIPRLTPVAVVGLTGAVAIASGWHHSLALRSDGTVWAWGWNSYGQLGDGTNIDRSTPVLVSGLTNVVRLAARWYHVVALRADKTVWAWGWNATGQLGDGTTTDRRSPVRVAGLGGVVEVAAGSNLSLGLVVPPVLNPISGNLLVGATCTLTGSGFTAGTVIKLYVATASGPVSYGPYVPQSWTSTSLTWAIPPDVALGNGFASVQVVNTDQGYVASNIVGALIEGSPANHIPTILYLNAEPLAPADPGVAVAHIDTVVPKGSTVTITGTGFENPGVNLFTAAGNLGPLWPLVGWTDTQLQVQVPMSAPTGPGNFQLVNSPYVGNVASNAVSAVVGAPVTITSVTTNGSTVTVTGTGFCTLSVINLYNKQGTVVVNLGGLGPSGPVIPLTVVSDTELRFEKPAGAVPGPAYVQVLNPPYIPFSSSGNDPDGAFTMP